MSEERPAAELVDGLPQDRSQAFRQSFIDDEGLLDVCLIACRNRGQWVRLDCPDTLSAKRRVRILRNKKLLVALRGRAVYVQNPRHAG